MKFKMVCNCPENKTWVCTERTPHCWECKRAIGEGKKKEDGPMLCGPCYHRIKEEGGRVAVEYWWKRAREEVLIV